MALVFEALAGNLVAALPGKYPAELFAGAWSEGQQLCCKDAVLDLRHGDLLRLDTSGGILKAFHGTSPLSAEEVGKRYEGSVWDLYSHLQAREKRPEYFYFGARLDDAVPAIVRWAHLTLLRCHSDLL